MKFDLHVHSFYSPDSITPVEKLCERYSKLGFGGFALTDHSNFGGVKKAQDYAREKKLPIQVTGGCEFMSDKGEVIGLDLNESISVKEFAPSGARPPPMEFAPLCDAIHDQGGTVILPHPFDTVRRHICRPDALGKDLVRLIDGLETFNARSVGMGPNEKSAGFASANSLASTGGSDAHFLFECGNGFTEIPDGMELSVALRKKLTAPGGQLSPFFVHGPTTLVKWGKRLGILPRP